MNTDFERIRQIFLTIAEQPSAQWDALLDEVCGNDADLRQQVAVLLKAHADGEGILDRNVYGKVPTGVFESLTELPGTVIGAYKLLEQIGEGGFGVVFMAEQTQPVRRKVALKVLKRGMDTRQVVARFEAERQALAIMDHPNIAKVFDGGETASGRPYFVMELVRGIPITDFSDQNHLTPRQRLELFLPVCQAVQHAHHKGIIHRDLKPSNVLVTVHDTTSVVKVIDFGVAKALGQELTEKTLFTGFAQMIGTPLYMSPEQAGQSGLDIDTRSDIYSLGVLLYELLTGTTPFDKERFRQAAYDEIRRIIREEEPPRPSTRLSESKDSLPSISAQRQTEPAKLTKLIRGELDWIVMKALEKDRNRRYETANGFAMDVQRYLADEAVQACPPSAGYRLSKFVRRNKAALAVAALVLFFVVLLGSGIGWMLRDREARQVRVAAQVDMILSEVEQLEKEQKWSEALIVARRAEALTAGAADAATQDRVRQVLNHLEMVSHLEFLRLLQSELTNEKGFDHEGAARRYSAAFKEYGVDVDSLSAEESAVRLQARPTVALPLALALDDWATMLQQAKDHEGAKRLWVLAEAVDPDPWRARVRQAAAAKNVAALLQLAKSPDLVRQPPHSQVLLAVLLQSRFPEESAAILERASELHAGDFWVHIQLASSNALMRPPRLDAALRHATAARALRPQSSTTWTILGVVLKKQGKFAEAAACHQRAIELDSKLAKAHHNLGVALKEQGKLDEAIASYKTAIELDPKHPHAYNALGNALIRKGQRDEAIPYYKKAIELDPKDPIAPNNLGMTLRQLKRPEEAIPYYRKAITLDPDYADAHSNLGAALNDLGELCEALASCSRAVELDWNHSGAHSNLGNTWHKLDQLEEAAACYRKAIELDPKSAHDHLCLGTVLLDQGKLDEALPLFRKAIERAPNDAAIRSELGDALYEAGKFPDAIACYKKAISIDPKYVFAHNGLGIVLYDMGKFADAIDCYKKAIAIDPQYGDAHCNLGMALCGLEKFAESIPYYKKAIELDQKNANAYSSLGNALCELEKFDEAIVNHKKAIELDREHASFHSNLGAVYLRHGKLDDAIACCKQAIKLDPKDGMAFNNLGNALALNGQPEEAIPVLRKAMQLPPRNSDTRQSLAEAIDLLAWRLSTGADLKARDPARALGLAKEACELMPNAADLWRTLGVAHYRAGDSRAAITALEKSLQLRKSTTIADGFFLAMAHWKLGDQEKARTWFDRAEQSMDKKHPNHEELRRFQTEAATLMKLKEKPNPK